MYGSVKETVKEAKKICLNGAMEKALNELSQIYDALEAMGLAEKIQIDLSIVNDIDYYNGIIFKGYVKELGKSVLAGGQYDQAMVRLGKKAEAIGFALYLNEINRISTEKTDFDLDAAILYSQDEKVGDVARAVRSLQEKGLSAQAQRTIPENIRYRELYTLKNGVLKKEEPSC